MPGQKGLMMTLPTFNLFGMNYNLHRTMHDTMLQITYLHGESKFPRLD